MIRIVTLNIWQEQGPWAQRIELVGSRLAELDPDVVCLQEVRDLKGRVPNQARTLAERLGMSCAYELAQEWGGGEEGLAILSKRSQVERDFCELPYTSGRSRRICLGAAVELPEGPCWVFTTHLAWRLADGDLRERQVLGVDAFVKEHTQGSSTAAVLTGDFNAAPDADEMRFLRGLTTLDGRRTYYQDTFELCNPGALGHTWTRANPYTQQLGWIEPNRRLDYIFVTPQTRRGAGTVHACRIVCSEPDQRGVWCSDHFGVLAEVTVAEVGESATE